VEGAARDLLVQLLIAMSQKDASKLADVLLELGLARARVDRNALRRDLQRLLARYWGRALVDAKFGTMLAELLDIIRWHHLRLPPDMALLVKTLGMGEGLGVVLDPTFNLMDVYVPLAEDLARRQFIPKQWVRQLLLSGVDALQMGMELPQQLRRILGDIERGGFEITVQPASFDPYLDRLEQLVNRMIVALLAAAFTVAAALLVAALHPVGLVRIVEFFFFFVLVLSGAFGTYVVALILRSRHSRRS
jgi:ubiquinone biosynthesis protein